MRSSCKRCIIALIAAAVSLGLLLICFYTGLQQEKPSLGLRAMIREQNNSPLFDHHRKLLQRAVKAGGVEPNRIWGDRGCSQADVEVNQGPTAPLPNGMPTHAVEIMNVGISGCDICDIHLSCGWFSSARLINPSVFKRLSYDDCLVNDGQPLVNGGTISFQYANIFPYHLSVTSVSCSC